MSATPLVDAHVVSGPYISYVHAEAARGIEIQLREEISVLKDKVKQLQHALSHVVPKCDYLHHPKKHQHQITEPCPVEELIRKAQNQ